MDSGNIGFVMICAALVFFMTPGLSCFYGGLVRRKNAVNTMFTSVVTIATGIVMWMLFGYSLSFGPDHGGVIGDFSWFGGCFPDRAIHRGTGHSKHGILPVSDDVRSHHTGTDYRFCSGQNEIQVAVYVFGAVEFRGILSYGTYGLG